MKRARSRVVRFYPQVRSVHLERATVTGPATTVYLERRDDFDETLQVPDRPFLQTRALRLPLDVMRLRPEIVELPEPLWVKYALHVAYLKIALFLRRPFQRPTYVFYAIENAGPDRVPDRFRWMGRWLWRALIGTLSGVAAFGTGRAAFGTEGARRAYRQTLPAPIMRRLEGRSRLIEALPAACDCSDTDGSPGFEEVLFATSLERRKGLDLLLEAWPLVAAEVPAARLILLGSGPLQAAALQVARHDRSVAFVEGASRAEVHHYFRRASVVVLPSQPESRWREQVGLPIVEGLAHGCHVVTTTESGLADALRSMGYRTLAVPTAPQDLARAILDALARSEPLPAGTLPSVDGRIAADQWLTSGVGDEASAR